MKNNTIIASIASDLLVIGHIGGIANADSNNGYTEDKEHYRIAMNNIIKKLKKWEETIFMKIRIKKLEGIKNNCSYTI